MESSTLWNQFKICKTLLVTLCCMKLCRHVSSSCICVSVSEPPGLHCEWSSSSEPPQPPHRIVIRVKPAASPTEAGGPDLPSSAFHLCLNATRLKHTHKALLLRFSSVFSALNPAFGEHRNYTLLHRKRGAVFEMINLYNYRIMVTSHPG